MKGEYNNKVMDTAKKSKQTYTFPEYGFVVLAESLEEAQKIAKEKINKLNN